MFRAHALRARACPTAAPERNPSGSRNRGTARPETVTDTMRGKTMGCPGRGFREGVGCEGHPGHGGRGNHGRAGPGQTSAVRVAPVRHRHGPDLRFRNSGTDHGRGRLAGWSPWSGRSAATARWTSQMASNSPRPAARRRSGPGRRGDPDSPGWHRRVYPRLVGFHNPDVPSLRCGGTADDRGTGGRSAIRSDGNGAWVMAREGRITGWPTSPAGGWVRPQRHDQPTWDTPLFCVSVAFQFDLG